MKAYEQLPGATGAGLQYRPERRQPFDVFEHRPPKAKIGGSLLRLHDLSLSGLALLADYASEVEPELDSILPFSLMQGEELVFSGRGQVRRLEETAFGLKIALRLHDRHFDLQALKEKNRAALLRTQLAAAQQPDAGLVPGEYKRLCADILHLLRRYENLLRNGPTLAANDETIETDFLAACEKAIRPAWRALWRDGNRIVRPLLNDRPAMAALKEYTELVLTPEFVHGPIWRRSFEKPFGYPGDFEVMDYVYQWRREGASAYGQLLHLLGLDVAECIGTRMQVMRETIADFIAARPESSPARIASLGCGPAREVELYLKDREASSRPAEFTLIDQDARALKRAYERCYPLTLGDEGAAVRCLNLSFMELIRASHRHPTPLQEQDLIYSVGLVDYLSPKLAKSLVGALFARLRPGGLLVIGNMNDTPIGNLWPMEFLADWRLYYRDDAAMRDLASDLDTQQVWTKTDPLGRVYMIYVWKPSA